MEAEEDKSNQIDEGRREDNHFANGTGPQSTERAEENVKGEGVISSGSRSLGRMYGGDEADGVAAVLTSGGMASEQSALEALQAKLKRKELKKVDHEAMNYRPFRKKFYTESREISAMSGEAVRQLRERLEVKIRGKRCPRPILTWEMSGLSERMLKVLKRKGWDAPFPIQAQTIPAIMSGRDIIGVARTGSGKTLAFLLPMIRHVRDQQPPAEGEGPIALIMAPARELAVQIYREARKLAKPMGVKVACVYGGSSVREQIAQLKAGASVVVCTPGMKGRLLSSSSFYCG